MVFIDKKMPKLLVDIREYFANQGVKEVKTPCMVRFPSVEPSLANFPVQCSGSTWYLRTSPESALKQIVCAEMSDIYEVGPVFRPDEIGKYHLSEFTMLEWYKVGKDYQELIQDIKEFLQHVGFIGDISVTTYHDLFCTTFGVNPHIVETEKLKVLAKNIGFISNDQLVDRELFLNVLTTYMTDTKLRGTAAVFVYDYPVELRCYSKLSKVDNPVAERFELFIDGLEIANGYQEILSVSEQRRCFEEENIIRERRGLAKSEIDVEWLESLKMSRLQKLSGVALGVERLLMKLSDIDDIRLLSPSWP